MQITSIHVIACRQAVGICQTCCCSGPRADSPPTPSPASCVGVVSTLQTPHMGAAVGQDPIPRGRGGVCRPQNGCMGHWILWAPEAPEILFSGMQGEIFVLPCMCMLKIFRILCRIQRWMNKTQKIILTPSDLLVGPWLMGA